MLQEQGCQIRHGRHYYEFFSPNLTERHYESEEGGEIEYGADSTGIGIPKLSGRKAKKISRNERWSEGDMGFRHPEVRTIVSGNWKGRRPLSGTYPSAYSGWRVRRHDTVNLSGILARLNVRKNWINIKRVDAESNNTLIGKAMLSVKKLTSAQYEERIKLFSDLIRELIYRQLQSSAQTEVATLAASGIIISEIGDVSAVPMPATKTTLVAPDHLLLRMLNAPPGLEMQTKRRLVQEVSASRTGTRSDFFPLVPYSRVRDAYAQLLSQFGAGPDDVNIEEVLEHCDRKSISVLKKLGLAREDRGRIIIFNHFPKTSVVKSFQATVRRMDTVAFVDEYLRQFPLATGFEVGKAMNLEFEKGWNESSFQRHGNQILGWVRFEDRETDSRGRRIAMTDEKVKLLAQYVSEGIHVNDIADLIDVGRATLFTWRKSDKNTIITKKGDWKLIEAIDSSE